MAKKKGLGKNLYVSVSCMPLEKARVTRQFPDNKKSLLQKFSVPSGSIRGSIPWRTSKCVAGNAKYPPNLPDKSEGILLIDRYEGFTGNHPTSIAQRRSPRMQAQEVPTA